MPAALKGRLRAENLRFEVRRISGELAGFSNFTD
jgi:hypothetical protein